MEIKLLPKSVRETLRSEVNIRSFAKCIAQLVFNSLDAKSASVAIRVNLVTFKIQVIDSGNGISKRNLKKIGFRYATNKYYSIEDLEKNPNIFISRGESLASIIKLSETVKITSRCSNNSKTYSKVFENGKSVKVSADKQRPSQGTTIMIDNFMYNLPVRKKSINQNTCLDEIKNEIEYIALMHPRTSFSLRNDTTGEIIFQTYRTKYVFQTATILYGKEFTRSLRKLCFNDKCFTINGLISIQSHQQNIIQYVYINNRFVAKTKIHSLLNTLIAKSNIIKNKELKTNSPGTKQKHAAFIINIKCPYSELDIVDYVEPEIEFKNWEIILSCVEEAIKQFLEKHNLVEIKEKKDNFQNGSPLTESIPKVRTSQIPGVIRGIPMKRKLIESENNEKCISLSSQENENILLVDVHPPPKKLCTDFSQLRVDPKNIFPSQAKETTNIVDLPTKLRTDSLIKELSYRLKQDIKPKKTEQTKNKNKNQLKLTRRSKKFPKIVPKEMPVVLNENHDNEKIKQDLVSLESNSECGKDIILDKFLRSTAVFRDDEDLKKELSIKSISNKSSPSCIISSWKKCNKTTVSTATKISITKAVEQNNFENDDHIFKVPTAPAPKKRKSSTSSDNVSNILAKDRATNKSNHKTCDNISFTNNFELDFIKNISKRNNIPSEVTNHVSKMLNNITKQPQNKNYKCTIHITKRMDYLQSSDFLQPAKKLMRKMPAIKCQGNRYDSRVLPVRHKEIVHSNSMLKTFHDMKNNFQQTNFINRYENNNEYKIHNFLPKINHDYLMHSKHNMEPLSSTFKREITNNFFPIYNIKRSNPKYIDALKKPYSNRIEKYNNRIYFPSPPISFKPYNTNPNLDKLFSKNSFSFSKPNLDLPCKYPSSNTLLNENKIAFNSPFSFIPTFESHQYTTNCMNNPQYSFCKDSKELLRNTRIYSNNQNFLPKKSSYENSNLNMDKMPKTTLINLENQKSLETDLNNYISNNIQEQSSPTFLSNDKKVANLPSTHFNNKNINYLNQNNIQPLAINSTPNNSNKKSVLSNEKEKFLNDFENTNNEIHNIVYNYTQNNITPNYERSEIYDKYYDRENITNWIDNNKNFINNTSSCYSELNNSLQVNNETSQGNKSIEKFNSCKNNTIQQDLDHSNVKNDNKIKSNKAENVNYTNDTTSKILPTINSKQKLENDKVSILFSSSSSPIISFPKQFFNTNKNQTIIISQDKSNNDLPEKNSPVIPLSQFSSASNLIQSKEFSNILNNLNQSILNDTLNITNLEKRNLEETKNGASGVTHDHRLTQSEKASNSGGPVFQEDSSNLILENFKTIDEILNNNQTGNNNPGIHNNYETTNNLQSNSNSLSKNVEESNEINKNVTESCEYGNQNLEWIKQTTELGNEYYLNTRTGMTSFGTPKNIDGCLITKRHAFMPKGMSQIMLDTSNVVTKELSPNSKNILHQTIANTENDELQTVKWLNFLENKDSEKFFNDLYSNCKHYEPEILNVNNYKLPTKIIAGFENYSFSKDDFDNITVINQCDNKFIVTNIIVQGTYNLLVLFDQHAVHERIRLEKLLKDYEENEDKLKTVKCNVPVKVTLDNFQIRMLQHYKQNFQNWGFVYEITGKKNVAFTHIPLCWQSKDDSNVKRKEFSLLESLITTLIQEESSWLRNIKRINVAIPICIQNTIKTEACRTAIKFGDPLSKQQCENLIRELFLCDLPFNCAHGRPTLYPIFNLNDLNNDEDEEYETGFNNLMD